MRDLYTLFLRLLISIVVACVISLFFFEGIKLFKTSLLAGIMMVLAYLFEYTRKRGRE